MIAQSSGNQEVGNIVFNQHQPEVSFVFDITHPHIGVLDTNFKTVRMRINDEFKVGLKAI